MLKSNPVLDEIRRLHEENRTGVLALDAANGEHVELCFREGLIEAASSNIDARRIGEYLVKDGCLDLNELRSVQSEAKRRKVAFGEAAVRTKLVEQSDVGAAVRAQAVDLIEHVLRSAF